MRYVSLFSGIEAASVAWHPLGWEPVAFSEVEPFCCDLLAERFPEVPNLGDITAISWEEQDLGAVDLVVGGSPCQSFSIAGGREGLDGESRLMLEYIRAVEEIHPRWLLWENVPGVFSIDEGRAFGILLDELEKLGYGLAWRVLDAQFFGVAQRRRRVFLVGRAGGGVGAAAAVLFESESVRGNTQSSSEKRQELARDRGEGARSAYFKLPAAIASNGQDIVGTLDAADGPKGVTGQAFNTGKIIIAFAQNTRDEVRIQGDGTIAGALAAQPGMKQTTYVIQGSMLGRSDDAGPNGAGINEDVSFTLNTTDRHAVVEERSYTVRRLTPLECERLQGFPDGWTDIGSDSKRYKALGNSMAVPVMRWLGERIAYVEGVIDGD